MFSLNMGWGGVVVWVAHKILVTAQSPNSSFPFLFDFGLGLGTWTRACQLCWQHAKIISPNNNPPEQSKGVINVNS